MAKSFPLTLELPQETIKVSVEFYDDAEKQKLLKYPTGKAMELMVKQGLDISTEQFLTYYLFHKKRPGKQGWRNFQEVSLKVGHALAELDQWVDFNGNSISTPTDLEDQDPAITERIGESIGLSVISHLHGLTEADWDRIPIMATKALDYRLASDGQNIIELETKGSSVEANSVKASTICNHRKSIAEKKKAIEAKEKKALGAARANLRYGTIVVMGEHRDKPVKCLLVDPPAQDDGREAARLRILQRMRFLADWISFISPRSQLASALQTRLASLEHLPDPFVLDGVPLLKGNGEQFDFTPGGGRLKGHSSFFATKSKITDSPDGGITMQLSDGNFFFLGIRQELLEQAAKQQLRSLIDFKTEHGSVQKTVECVFTEHTFNWLSLPASIRNSAGQFGGYHSLELSGRIFYNDAGVLFGVLPLPKEK